MITGTGTKTRWEESPFKALLYFELFGAGGAAGKMVQRPGRAQELTAAELLDYYLEKAQEKFERYCVKGSAADTVVNSDWLLDFVKWYDLIGKIRQYLLIPGKPANSRSLFVDQVMNALQEYSVFDTRSITAAEEKGLRRYFSLLVGIMQKTMSNMYRTSSMMSEKPMAGAEAEARYLAALQSREIYLELIKEFLSLGGREDWNRINLVHYPDEVWKTRYDMQLLRDEYLYAYGNRTVAEWQSDLAGTAWEREVGGYWKRWLCRRTSAEAAPSLLDYYNHMQACVDFALNTLANRQDGPNWQGMQVDMLLYFAKRFSWEVPERNVKELLKFCQYPPAAGEVWLPERYMTKSQIRQEIVRNIKQGLCSDMVLGWHISYCIDHEIDECRDKINKISKNPARKMQTRRLAAEYVCRYMDVEAACKEFLPGMKGDAFFYSVKQYANTGNGRLAEMVWHYGERYIIHKMRCDVLLVHMQNRRGIQSFLHHIRRRHKLPPESREYDIIGAIRGLSHPEILEDLGQFFLLSLKDTFKDDPEYSMRDASAEALVRAAQEYEQEIVSAVFAEALKQYGEVPEKAEYIRRCMERAGMLVSEFKAAE